MAVILQNKPRLPVSTRVFKELGALLESVVEANGRVRGDYVGRVEVAYHVEEKSNDGDDAPLLGRSVEAGKWVVF